MKHRILTLLLLLGFQQLSAQHDLEIRQDFLKSALGNWYEPGSNSWDYGFFEEFAIYRGKFWDYEVIYEKQDAYGILLKDGQSTVNLEIRPTEEGFFIKNESGHTTTYERVGKTLPRYTVTDTTRFTDRGYHRVDTAVITGYLRNNQSEDPFKVSVYNMWAGESTSYYGDLDRHGRFVVKVPLYNTSEVYVDWGRSTFITVLDPGEIVFLFKNLGDQTTIFHGENARLKNEIAHYYDETSFSEHFNPKNRQEILARINYERSLSYEDFLDYKVKALDSLLDLNQNYFSSNRNLSTKAKLYIESSTEVSIATDLTDHTIELPRPVPAFYLNFMKDHFMAKGIAEKRIIRNYHFFINHFVSLNMPTVRFTPTAQVFAELAQQNKINAPQNVIDFADLFSRYVYDHEQSNFSLSTKDSLAMVEIMQRDTSVINLYHALTEDYKEIIDQYVKIESGIEIYKDVYREHLDQEWFDILYTRKILQFLEKEFGQPEFLVEEIIAPISNRHFKDFILKENSRIVSTSQEWQYTSLITNANHLRETEDVDQLIQEILAPHIGKVVYIDFWGTWCSPCLKEMDYVPALKKALEGEEVIFIYLANNSPEANWAKIIKSKYITGENTIHYNLPRQQQSMIERRLGVRSFPTYFLVNKEGEILNIKPPRPSQKDQLVEMIKNLLENVVIEGDQN